MIAAVIFDMDGCLVDSEPLSLAAVAAEIGAQGLAATPETVRARYLGVSLGKIKADLEAQIGAPCPEGFESRVEARFFARASELRPIAGAAELLARLAASGVGVGLATGSSVVRMGRTLAAAGLSAQFPRHAISADQVARGKPAPDVFLAAAASLGVDPRDCAVLEDSPHGVAGAVAAGMRAIGFVGGSHLSDIRAQHAALLRAQGAQAVVEDLDAAFAALTAE